MSFRSFLIKLLGGTIVTDQTVDAVAAGTATDVVADTAAVDASSASQADSSAATGVDAQTAQSETADTAVDSTSDATATAVDTATLQSALNQGTSSPVTDSEWDTIVAYAKKADADIFSGIKKALSFLEHEALSIFDEAVALIKLKK